MLKKISDKFDTDTLTSIYKIEKNVPMPTWYRNKATGYRGRYPFEDMKKNDSILIPCAPVLQSKTGIAVHQASNAYSKRWDQEFKGAYRSVTGGIRFWRTN
jgi:hypothetical protein|tara:strand:- start:217 stop:519 length:303 start_codon:yes stop_codon:yes gene_type:complete